MRAIAWTSVLPLIIVTSLIIYDEWVSTPTCKIVHGVDPNDYESGGPDDLKVMMVANLLLLGSDSGFINRYFRDYYMAKLFRKSFHTVNPGHAASLGRCFRKRVEVDKKDLGECSGLDARSVDWVAGNFPGLDSSGCGAFQISNISFVSLNTVAMLCGNNKIRFRVEKFIETESIDLRVEAKGTDETVDESSKFNELYHKFSWRENGASSRSGPVLLLHFPLHRTIERKCSPEIPNTHKSREFSEPGPYGLLHTVPLNVTEYIFQALKPRIIFSAHTHEFCDYTHSDGTREVTVSAMTWKARDDPGFVVANFHGNRKGVSVSYCSLARESHLLIAYTSVLVLLLSILLIANITQLT